MLLWEGPHTDLPSASTWAQQEVLSGDDLYFSGGDISSAFYRLKAPEQVAKYLTLPRIRAKFVNISSIDGHAVQPDQFLVPELTVLPMGRTWSLWLCQMVIEELGRQTRQTDEDMIADQNIARPMKTHDVRHGKYVDNF